MKAKNANPFLSQVSENQRKDFEIEILRKESENMGAILQATPTPTPTATPIATADRKSVV
jgi:hypothetical protein